MAGRLALGMLRASSEPADEDRRSVATAASAWTRPRPRAPARAVRQRPRGTPGTSSRLRELEIVAQKRQVTSVKVIGVRDDSLVASHCRAARGARPRARPPRTREEILSAEETAGSPGRRWRASGRCALWPHRRIPADPDPGERGRAPDSWGAPLRAPSALPPPSDAPPSAGGRLTAPQRLGPGLGCERVGGAREPNRGEGRGDGREQARRGGDEERAGRKAGEAAPCGASQSGEPPRRLAGRPGPPAPPSPGARPDQSAAPTPPPSCGPAAAASRGSRAAARRPRGAGSGAPVSARRRIQVPPISRPTMRIRADPQSPGRPPPPPPHSPPPALTLQAAGKARIIQPPPLLVPQSRPRVGSSFQP